MPGAAVAETHRLKRTAFFRTKRRLESLEPSRPLCLRRIVQLYRSEQTQGSLNYARAILKKKQIIYMSLKENMVGVITGAAGNAEVEVYRELQRCKVLEQAEIVQILKEAVMAHPEPTFQAVTGQSAALLEIFGLVQLDISDAVSIVAKGMLEQNKGRILAYINELTYSFTLKCLIKDGAGMAYLARTITEALTEEVDTPGKIREMVSQVISVCLSLVKIDFTLVLLNPVLTYLKPALTKTMLQCGPDIGAESLFSGISSRIEELVEEAPGHDRAGAAPHSTPLICRESILSFLFSLIPYDSMVETLALTISRDLVLGKGSRKRFLQVFEDKVGTCRISNVNIIKEDFAYFSPPKLPAAGVLAEATKAFRDAPQISIPEDVAVCPFVCSNHYWPENNFSLPEDLLSFSSAPRAEAAPIPAFPQGPAAPLPDPGLYLPRPLTLHHNEDAADKISLSYLKEHSYAEITVEENGKSLDLVVPVMYLEYFIGRAGECAGQQPTLPPAVAEFWDSVKLKLS